MQPAAGRAGEKLTHIAASVPPVPLLRSEHNKAREFQTIDQMASFIENLPDYNHQQVRRFAGGYWLACRLTRARH